MGYYINEDSKGNGLPASFTGKVQKLLDDGAVLVSGNEFEENLVCVVDNGFFAAAGYAYSEEEYNTFKQPDGRYKKWLVYEHAAKLSGYKKEKETK